MKRATTITVGLVLTLALLTAVGPFANDMYTPSFPEVTTSLDTTSTMVGLTLAAFFVGMGLGQVFGGTLSDRLGRRGPILVGGVVCTLGGLGCVLAPSIGWLIVARVIQGLGGGATAAIARAVAVDMATGDRLARVMTLLGAVFGLAPVLAPVFGGIIASVASWRVVFWILAGLGVVMTTIAWAVVPESLPPERRHAAGSRFVHMVGQLLHTPAFVGYMIVNGFSSAALIAYIADSSYAMQGVVGMTPLAYSLFFAGNALVNMLLSFLNSWLVGRFRPRALIRVGLAISSAGVALLAVSVFALGTSLVPTGAGFVLLLSGQAFIFGNSQALALAPVRHIAGTASAVMGLVGSLVNAGVAPLASSGGMTSAVPMAIVMLAGAIGAWVTYVVVGRAAGARVLS